MTLLRLIECHPPRHKILTRIRPIWARFNQLVECAEGVIGRSIEHSTTRADVGARFHELRCRPRIGIIAAGHRRTDSADRRDVSKNSSWTSVESTRQTKSARRIADEKVRQIVDHLLLRRTPKQLTKLALHWHDALEKARAGDENLIACMRGDR